MKKSLICALALLPCLLLCGCMQKDGDTVSIYYLNFKPEIADVYDEIAAVYEEETGVRLKVVTAASNTYEQTLKSEIAKSDAPTIFQVNGPRGYAAWKDYCADLSDTQLYKALTDKSLAIRDGDAVYGIPYIVEGYGILYNRAITDRYFALSDRQKEIDSMEDIDSFEKLKTVVEDMTAHKAELSINGVFASTSLKSGEDWRWQTHLANIPVYYEFKNRSIDLTSDATKEIAFEYADNFKNIFDLYLNNSTTSPKLLGSKQVADSMAEFALGQCAMVQNGNWAYSQIATVSGNTVKAEDIAFLPIYMGIEGEEDQGLCIGTENFFCINAKASEEKQKASADFLYWLFSSEKGKSFVTGELGFVSPFDTIEESERPSDPLTLEMLRWMEDEDKNTIDWNFTLFPGQTFKDEFGSALLRYAQGTIDWDKVKQTVIEGWRRESE
ncbi:MAG: ABC transporter substrate-binding protein [Ruminococcaceae bacterium]|nr:ABC transporter substrate-binding protein [Oscillospiraceae bacterium]